QELLAEVAQLGVADAVNEVHLLQRRGADARQLAQRRVAEDEVRLHATLVGQLAAALAQQLEQGHVHALPRGLLRPRLLRPLPFLAAYRLDEPHAALAAPHLP